MSSENAKLIKLQTGQANVEILLTHDVTTIGRAVSCQVVIDNQFSSRRHAQIIKRDELYWVRDLGSKNGTLLNNELVKSETLLTDGAEIKIGDINLRFVDPAATRTHPGISIATAPLWLETDSRQVWLNGEKLTPSLSVKQFDLLAYLYQRAGEAVSKDELALAVWPEDDSEGIYNYQIDKMVSRVRDRVGKDTIETVWGYGYRLKV